MEKMNDFKCAVSADLFARANLARSTEGMRYYLNGVYVTPAPQGGAFLVGTNGHWLVVVHDPRGIVEGSAIVSLNKRMVSDLKSARGDCSSPFGHRTERVLAVADSKAMVVLSSKKHEIKTEEGTEEVEARGESIGLVSAPNKLVISAQFSDVLIDGTFPDYTRVIPSDVDATRAMPAVDPKYLSLAVKAITQDKKGPVRFLPGPDESSPSVVVPSHELFGWTAAAVVMPLRSSGAVSAPTFWKPQ